MKRLFIILTLLFCTITKSHAGFFYNDSLLYIINEETREATLIDPFLCDCDEDIFFVYYPEYTDIPTEVFVGEESYPVIGVEAFCKSELSYTSDVTTVHIPSSVIYVSGFSNVPNLSNVIFEEGTKHVSGFYDCPSLQHIDLPTSIESIGSFGSFSALEEFSIPPAVERLTAVRNFLENCPNLRMVDLGNRVKNLPSNAFSNSTALEKIAIPASVATIGNNAFNNCTGLTVVELLPEQPIDLKGFLMGCSGLKEFYCHSAEPHKCDYDTFQGINFNKCTLYVPQGSAEAYRNAWRWSSFRNIVEFDPSGVELVSRSDSLSISVDGRVVVTGSPAEISSLSGSLSITATEENCADIRLQPGVYAARQGSASSSHIVVR